MIIHVGDVRLYEMLNRVLVVKFVCYFYQITVVENEEKKLDD